MTATGCVIFDIDQTLIDENEERIESTCSVFELTEALGYLPMMITARPDTPENKMHTVNFLKKHKLSYFDRLYMMPNHIQPTTETVSNYKRLARNTVAQKYTILANIGDMWTDFMEFPLQAKKSIFTNRKIEESAIFFPTTEYGEVCLKLPGILNA